MTNIKFHCPECGSVGVSHIPAERSQNNKSFWSCDSGCGYRSAKEFPFTTKEERDNIDRCEGRLSY